MHTLKLFKHTYNMMVNHKQDTSFAKCVKVFLLLLNMMVNHKQDT